MAESVPAEEPQLLGGEVLPCVRSNGHGKATSIFQGPGKTVQAAAFLRYSTSVSAYSGEREVLYTGYIVNTECPCSWSGMGR